MDPEDLKYTNEHEWVRVGESRLVRFGITDYAQQALGDIVYVSLPGVGSLVVAGSACGEVESTKSVSDLYSPVTGTVISVNELLDGSPETVNSDPYGQGWMVEVESSDELDELLDATEYADFIGRL
ncbi:MAG: glycine cleavage system protein GcvH [Actinomycetes bacterium]